MAEKVTEDKLRGIINSEINNSIGFMKQSYFSKKNLWNITWVKKLGTEIDGRSQVVSTDVADTIETILPNLLRIFTNLVIKLLNVSLVKSEDVPLAEQATNYINYIFNKDNPGFSVLYTWFKDALLEKMAL